MLASASMRSVRSMVPLKATTRFFSAARNGSRRRAKVVVVGSGRMGHIRSSLVYSNPRFDLCGIVDINREGAASLADIFHTQPYQFLDEAVEDVGQTRGPLDAVIVSSPTFTHESVIAQAARYGLHVFTEKPVDETAGKIAKLYDIAAAAGISLCCGFQRRFDASYVATANAVRLNKIGTPIMANIFFADHPSPPKEFLLNGGNIFMDLSAHDVDYIMHALQDNVVSVYATGTSSTDELAAAGVHDNATVMLKFRRGTIVSLFLSRSATYGYDQRVEIFGEKGLISTQNESAHSAVLSNGDGILHSKLKHSFPQRFQPAFATELDAFCSTVLLDTPWPVTADECIRVQRVADAAKLSCEEDRLVKICHETDALGTETVSAIL